MGELNLLPSLLAVLACRSTLAPQERLEPLEASLRMLRAKPCRKVTGDHTIGLAHFAFMGRLHLLSVGGVWL